jgi:hypothetical protein
MELHEFVKETLVQIVSGVVEAQRSEVVSDSSGAIAPSGHEVSDKDRLVQEVKFDVGITAGSGTATKGGVGVFIGPVTLGSQGTSKDTNASTNRVQFSIPIYLPSQKINRKKAP